MGRRKSGGIEGILLVIAVVIGLIITVVQYLWPVLLAAAVLGVGLYFLVKYLNKKNAMEAQKQAEIDKLTKKLQSLETQYNSAKSQLQMDPNQPFVKSLFDQLELKIEIVSTNINIVEGSLSEEEGQTKIESLKDSLENYCLSCDKQIAKEQTSKFLEFNKIISSISAVRWVNRVPPRKYIYPWDDDVVRVSTKFKKKYFNKVIPSNSLDVFAVACDDITYYFYPEFIVEARSENAFKIINYSSLSFAKVMGFSAEDGRGLSGSKMVGSTYLHTKANGDPDLRYSYNPQYGIYQYYYLCCKNLTEFVFEIGDETLTNKMCKALEDLAGGMKIDVGMSESEEQESIEANSENGVDDENTDEGEAYDDTQIVGTMKSIFDSFGKEIVLEKRFIYMLDDYKVFDDVAYFKNILRLVQGENVMNELVEQGSWNNKCLAIVSSLSQKYMLQEDALERLLKDIVLAING